MTAGITAAAIPAGRVPAEGIDGADGILATHPFVTAIPFFFPTLIIIAVIGIVVWRDRHADPSGGDAAGAEPAETGSAPPAAAPPPGETGATERP